MAKEMVEAYIASDFDGEKTIFFKQPEYDEMSERYMCDEYEPHHIIDNSNIIFAMTAALKAGTCKKVRITIEEI